MRLADVTDVEIEATERAKRRGSVVDLFCGAGGLSHGFFQEGYHVAAGIDLDEDCRFPFEENNGAPFVRRDVGALDSEELRHEFTANEPMILVGCAPCQPFSKYSQGREDGRWRLLEDFSRLIRECQPDIVSMENVPRLVQFKEGSVFGSFVDGLKAAGYSTSWTVAYCPDFGIPQSRSRLVLMASRHGEIGLPKPTCSPDTYATVRDTIGSMPQIEAGAEPGLDPMHRSSALSARNLERIRSSVPGGTWRDWSDDLVTSCHQRESGRGYSSVYGRMSWDEPAPTMTTQFFGFGNGRFGHPDQDRAISLREGAMLQTFPKDYAFVKPGEAVQFKRLGRMIGNAVPVALGRAIAKAVSTHIDEVGL